MHQSTQKQKVRRYRAYSLPHQFRLNIVLNGTVHRVAPGSAAKTRFATRIASLASRRQCADFGTRKRSANSSNTRADVYAAYA